MVFWLKGYYADVIRKLEKAPELQLYVVKLVIADKEEDIRCIPS